LPTLVPTNPPTQAPVATNTAQPPTAAPTNMRAPTAESSPTTTFESPAVKYMYYRDFEIIPETVTIRVGTKVVFLIKSESKMFHQPYTFDTKDPFESPVGLGDGTSFAHAFNVVGTIVIHCGYHDNMKATVNVIQ
jgi:plastocyanin